MTREQVKNKYYIGCVVHRKFSKLRGIVIKHHIFENILVGISVKWENTEVNLFSYIGITELSVVSDNKLNGLFYNK